MKKNLVHPIIILLVFLLTISCTLPFVQKTDQLTAEPTPNGPADTEQAFSTEQPVAAVEEAIDMADFTVEPLFAGGVTFVADPVHTASLALDAAAEADQTLTLTASDGTLWTLTVPPGALDDNVEIRLTELKNITSADLGPLQNGLLLEPDGLRFHRYATLTAQGTNQGDAPIFFIGSHSGDQLDLAMTMSVNGMRVVYLQHFSTLYSDPFTDATKRRLVEEAIEEGYGNIMKRALQVLEQNPPPIAEPPSITMHCLDTTGERYQADLAKIKAFEQAFREPEYGLISALLTLSIGTDPALWDQDTDTAAFKVIRQLADRSMQKVKLLYDAYYPTEEYFLAVRAAGQNTETEVDNLEVVFFKSDTQRREYFDRGIEWAELLALQFLPKVRDEHDFEYVIALLTVDQWASLQGNYEGQLSDLSRALTFLIQFDLTANTDSDNVTWQTQGSVEYNTFAMQTPINGKGVYTFFEWTIPDEDMPVMMTSPMEYDLTVVVKEMDFCDTKTATVLVNRFSRDPEEYVIDGVNIPLYGPNGLVSEIMMNLYEPEMVETPKGLEEGTWYQFTVPLVNRQEVPGSLQFERSDPDESAALTIQIIHTPK